MFSSILPDTCMISQVWHVIESVNVFQGSNKAAYKTDNILESLKGKNAFSVCTQGQPASVDSLNSFINSSISAAVNCNATDWQCLTVRLKHDLVLNKLR